jgi:hypothetical protein
MIVRIDKSFQKDVSKLNDAKTKHAIIELVKNTQLAENLSSINNIKKLAGYKDN